MLYIFLFFLLSFLCVFMYIFRVFECIYFPFLFVFYLEADKLDGIGIFGKTQFPTGTHHFPLYFIYFLLFIFTLLVLLFCLGINFTRNIARPFPSTSRSTAHSDLTEREKDFLFYFCFRFKIPWGRKGVKKKSINRFSSQFVREVVHFTFIHSSSKCKYMYANIYVYKWSVCMVEYRYLSLFYVG